jgi:prepilin-type N-terminal cleavage/methylation domain-containing protein
MKTQFQTFRRGFTLLETVIAIGVLAVLLTGFMIVFAPAAAGIRKSMTVQEADRLASTIEQEIVNLRSGEESTDYVTGFDKAYRWIEDSMKKSSPEVVFVYQYRGSLTKSRTDGSPEPVKATDGVPGADYAVVPMARRRTSLTSGSDPFFEKDLQALEGRVYAVKVKQLVYSGGQMIASTKEVIEDPTPGEAITGTTPPVSGKYPEAVIAFSAEFYNLQSSSPSFLKTGGKFDSSKLKTPVFTRNLAVRR